MELFAEVIAPAERPELEGRRERLHPRLRMGTSSWTFPGWGDLVWGQPTSAAALGRVGLEAYARHPVFRSVGVDRSFYGPVPVATYAKWRTQVPEDFRFLVKAQDVLTMARFPKVAKYGDRGGRRNPQFLDAAYAAEEVVGPAVEGLGDRLGTLLFQFTPMPADFVGSDQVFAERLHAFLSALPKGPHYAVEIRTSAWMSPVYGDALADAGASHSYVVHPKMPPIGDQIRVVRGGARHGLVIRWMLRRDLSYGTAKEAFSPFRTMAQPDTSTREALARLIRLALGKEKDVMVIVNNKAEGSAPLSVEALEAMVSGAG